jgi:hypothetical protein
MSDFSFPELTNKDEIIAKWNTIQQAEYNVWYARLIELQQLDNKSIENIDKWYYYRSKIRNERIYRYNSITPDELARMTPYQLFDLKTLPAWLDPLFKIGSTNTVGY